MGREPCLYNPMPPMGLVAPKYGPQTIAIARRSSHVVDLLAKDYFGTMYIPVILNIRVPIFCVCVPYLPYVFTAQALY